MSGSMDELDYGRMSLRCRYREQGAKARLRVLRFGEELFATVGSAKQVYDALNIRNVFRKIPRREMLRKKDNGEQL